MDDKISVHLHALTLLIEALPESERVAALNTIRMGLHEVSPMKSEPVDCVLWVEAEKVIANDYNPNSVAPPEMELLKISILQDGYTQPIVAFEDGEGFTVVDGFHRNRVGKEDEEVRARVKGYLPVTRIKADREDKADRIASTIRHNRARGKHRVEAMSDIVVELKNRNWTNSRIGRELGMDEDEVLRLLQITGLSEMFKDQDFSRSWEIEDSEAEYEPLTDEFDEQEKDIFGFRTVNTSDENRVFHTFDKWECHKAGFYESSKDGLTKEQAEAQYAAFLADDTKFRSGLEGVIGEWKHSCEHYLTNASMNRIAWLGQAAACYSVGLPATYRGGFNLLSKEKQDKANQTALEFLNRWLINRDLAPVTLEQGLTDRQSTIY